MDNKELITRREPALLISCPECDYSKETDARKFPSRSVTATCPRCRHRFTFNVTPEPERQEPGLGEQGGEGFPSESSLEATTPGPEGPMAAPAERPEDKPAYGATRPTEMEPEATPSPPADPEGEEDPTHRVSFHGNGLTLLRLYVVNNLLVVLTLGIYHFWGKAKIRRYLYGSTGILGERFSFTGTGRELMNGGVKAGLLMMLIFSGPNALSTFVHPAFGFAVFPIMLVLYPAVKVGARRYKLSRTWWHGASFSFSGRIWEYVRLHVTGTLLTFLTLGLYSPWFHVRKERFWRTNSNYGSASFDYDGVARDIRKDFFKAWLLTLPTLGLCWFWYKAKVARYDWEHTSFGELGFTFDATGRQFLAFTAGNLALLAVTLGFGYPWVIIRRVKFLARHLTIMGDVEFARIAHKPDDSKAVGEGLAGILDIDMAI